MSRASGQFGQFLSNKSSCCAGEPLESVLANNAEKVPGLPELPAARASWVVQQVWCPTCDAEPGRDCCCGKPWHEGPITHRARLMFGLRSVKR